MCMRVHGFSLGGQTDGQSSVKAVFFWAPKLREYRQRHTNKAITQGNMQPFYSRCNGFSWTQCCGAGGLWGHGTEDTTEEPKVATIMKCYVHLEKGIIWIAVASLNLFYIRFLNLFHSTDLLRPILSMILYNAKKSFEPAYVWSKWSLAPVPCPAPYSCTSLVIKSILLLTAPDQACLLFLPVKYLIKPDS